MIGVENGGASMKDDPPEPPDEQSMPEEQKFLVATGIAPCGCKEFYDPHRRTKVAECETRNIRPAGCKRNID